jgi:hypothetical protein
VYEPGAVTSSSSQLGAEGHEPGGGVWLDFVRPAKHVNRRSPDLHPEQV